MVWTTNDMPNQAARVVVVTGANSGLGFEASRAFAAGGARVIMACRNAAKAESARQRILNDHRGASVEVMTLDLASLASVRKFAAELGKQTKAVHVLCNNAGVMALPRCETAEGFEMQIGTNHLGHFALTVLILPLILAAPAARVVTQSSGAHRMGRIDFDDLDGSRRYGKWTAYAQSKLANLLFAFELDRRLRKQQASAISVARHPGYAATELQFAGPKMEGSSFMERVMALGNQLLAQDAATGALPMLYAATAANVAGGDYIGPDGIGELWGQPKKVEPVARARDPEMAARLWQKSAELTGVDYKALGA